MADTSCTASVSDIELKRSPSTALTSAGTLFPPRTSARQSIPSSARRRSRRSPTRPVTPVINIFPTCLFISFILNDRNKARKCAVNRAGRKPTYSGQILVKLGDRFTGYLFKQAGKVVRVIKAEFKSQLLN